MTEILFRGKRTDNGEWVYGYYVCIGKEHHYICVGKLDITKGYPQFAKFEVIPETVGQYTGLTDKDGTKIFTGDIVKNDCGDIGIICFGTYASWSTKHLGFCINWHNDKLLRRDILYWLNEDKASVIHDNPELEKERE